MIAALIGTPTRTNLELAHRWRSLGVDARVLWPREAVALLRPGDAAITRLDVLPTLDGVEPGLEQVELLAEHGVRVLNSPEGLLGAHDKLLTAERLAAAGLPRPWTAHVVPGEPVPALPFPCVLKPRFGSWGEDVFLCRTRRDLDRVLRAVARRPWWRRHGALAQEHVGPGRSDVRLVVAGERIAAAARRVAPENDWRTNVTLGGVIVAAGMPSGTEELAVRAAAAIGIDFASVDLLPVDGDWVVLELNGAVDFDARYALPGVDPYAAVLDGLGLAEPGMRRAARRGTLEVHETKEAVMAKTVQGKPARPGDEITITGHAVGDSPRTAVILDVLGEPGHERFRVRWEDGHESIFFPGEDAVIRRPARARAKSTA